VPTSWSWDFGDGNSSTIQNPAFTYSIPGTYSVSLVTGNTAGISAIDIQTGYISVSSVTTSGTAPVASFQESPASGTAPLTVQFTDTSSNVPISWIWDFGDGNTSTSENPSYTYTIPGTYTVTLTATNAGGTNEAVQSSVISVNAATAGVPVASFTESSTAGTAPFTVLFTDTSSNTPASWTWDFGDGGTSTEENPSYTYANSGSFTVTLAATNAAGSNMSVQQDTIDVSTAPPAEATFVPVATAIPEPTIPQVSFEGTPTSGPPPLVVRFIPTAPGSPESFAWDFGDGGTSTEREPSYTYIHPGTYTVTFTVKYPGGSRPSEKESYIVVTGGSSTSSPLSSVVPTAAIAIAVITWMMIAGRRRGR
jgi:PKD repeat protein